MPTSDIAKCHLHAKFHLDPSSRLATVHQRYRQDRQLSDSVGWTILQMVAQKLPYFTDGLTNQHEILHRVANWPSEP